MRTSPPHKDPNCSGFPSLCVIGFLAGLLGGGITSPAAAQVEGHAYGEPADLAGPQVGTTDSPIRVRPALGAGEGETTRYQFGLGFTRATIECCVEARCEVLQGNVMVYGDAVSSFGSEDISFGRGIVGNVDVYGLEPTSSTVVGQPARMQGASQEGSYTRVGPDLTLTLTVPDWTWITRMGKTMICPSATVRIEGAMATAPCEDSECAGGSAQHFGFGPSTLTISPVPR